MTEPMAIEKLSSLMGRPTYDPDLVNILIEGLDSGIIPKPDMALLEEAGYLVYDKVTNTSHATLAARELLKDVPEWIEEVNRAAERFRERRRQAIRRRLEEAQ